MVDKSVATKGSLIKFRVATNEREIMEAAAEQSHLTLSEWARRNLLALARGAEIVADNDRGSKIEARARALGDSIRRNEALNEKIKARAVAAGMATANKPDPEKIAAFQRKCGMDVFDAKRRGKR